MTTITAQTTQIYNVYIKATPEQIWAAITETEFTQKYFHGGRVEAANGRRVMHRAERRAVGGRSDLRVRSPAQIRPRMALAVRPRARG